MSEVLYGLLFATVLSWVFLAAVLFTPPGLVKGVEAVLMADGRVSLGPYSAWRDSDVFVVSGPGVYDKFRWAAMAAERLVTLSGSEWEMQYAA